MIQNIGASRPYTWYMRLQILWIANDNFQLQTIILRKTKKSTFENVYSTELTAFGTENVNFDHR